MDDYDDSQEWLIAELEGYFSLTALSGEGDLPRWAVD